MKTAPLFIIVDCVGIKDLPEDMDWTTRREMLLQIIDSLIERYDPVQCATTAPKLDLNRLMRQRLMIDSVLREQYESEFTRFYFQCVAEFNRHGLFDLVDEQKSFDYIVKDIDPSGRVLLQQCLG